MFDKRLLLGYFVLSARMSLDVLKIMTKVILKGSRVKLRARTVKDAIMLARWYRDKEIMKFFAHDVLNNSQKEEEEYARRLLAGKYEVVNFAIEDEAGALIGDIGLERDDFNKNGSLWIMVGDKSKWGRGYAQEAVAVFIDFVFKKLKYNRLELTVTKDFARGVKIYKKFGFKFEGVKRESEWDALGKKFRDEVVMSILKKEWQILRKKYLK